MCFMSGFVFLFWFNHRNNSVPLCFSIPATQLKNLRFRNVKEVVQGTELDDEDEPGASIPVCFSFCETLLQKGEPK